MLAEEMGGGSGPPGGMARGLQSLSCQLPAVHREPGEHRPVLPQGGAPQAHTHLGAGGGRAGPPWPHALSRTATAPRLGTSPRRARPPAAPSPASQGKLRCNAKEQRSLSPPNPDTGSGPHTVPMSWVAGQQPWWPRWDLRDALQLEGTRDTVHKQPPPAVGQPRMEQPNPLVSSWQHWGGSALLLPTTTGAESPSWTAGTGFFSLPSSVAGLCSSSPARLAALPSRGRFLPRLVPPCKVPVPYPHRKGQRGGAERCKRLHAGTTAQSSSTGTKRAPSGPASRERCWQPAAERDGCPCTVPGGERGWGLLPWGPGWW